MPDVAWEIVSLVAMISSFMVVGVILLVDYKGANTIVLSWLPLSLAATIAIQYFGFGEDERKELLEQFLKSAFATLLLSGSVVWTFYIGIMNKERKTLPMWSVVSTVVVVLMYIVSNIAKKDVNMVWSFIAGLFGTVMILYFFMWSPPLELEKSSSAELYMLLKKTDDDDAVFSGDWHYLPCLGKKDKITEEILNIKNGEDTPQNIHNRLIKLDIFDVAKANSLIEKIKKPIIESEFKLLGAFFGTFAYTFLPPLLTYFDLHVWAGIVSNTPKTIIIVMLWEWNSASTTMHTPPPASKEINFEPVVERNVVVEDIDKLKFKLVEYLSFCAYSILITSVFLSIMWFNEIESMSDDFIRVGSTAFGMTVLIIAAILVPLVYPSICKCAEWAEVEHPKRSSTIGHGTGTMQKTTVQEEESLLGLRF